MLMEKAGTPKDMVSSFSVHDHEGKEVFARNGFAGMRLTW
jgi:hypothetical protein